MFFYNLFTPKTQWQRLGIFFEVKQLSEAWLSWTQTVQMLAKAPPDCIAGRQHWKKAAVAQLHQRSQKPSAHSAIWSRVKRPCAAANTGGLESLNRQESFMLVQISVPDCGRAQPASATTTPGRKKLSWGSAASFPAVLFVYACGSELHAPF